MLSYRHGFHAGNHADVLKHIVLTLILDYLKQKNKPYWFIDTHAGAGKYSLESEFSNKTSEHLDGIKKIFHDEKNPLGRPKESNTDRGKQENAFGKDPLGRKGMKNDDNESSRLRPKFKGGSPLAMEQREMLKKVPGPQRTGKQLVFEQEKKGNDLLDENQLK